MVNWGKEGGGVKKILRQITVGQHPDLSYTCGNKDYFWKLKEGDFVKFNV